MKAKAAHYKLISPIHICIFFTLIAISLQAHAEYYLVYGGEEPAMVEINGSYYHHVHRHHYAHHFVRHHWTRRNSYNIQVYYFLRPDCCGATSYYAPVVPAMMAPVEYVPVPYHHRYRDNGGLVFMAQPDMYSGSQINYPDYGYGYDSDQRTGDDFGPGMDIDY
jgi:hypothetical protein